MKTRLLLAAVAGMLVAASAYAIPTVTFTESPDGITPVAVSWNTGVGGWTLGAVLPAPNAPTPETAIFRGTDGIGIVGTQYIAYWEDLQHTILSDYVKIVVGPPATGYTISFFSDPETGTFSLPDGATATYNVTEIAGIMSTTVQTGANTIQVNVDSGVDVPDGGLTAMLLGMGMLGLGWVRRMVK